MITFNPGPSQISPKIVNAIQEVALSGFLSLSHRSEAFMQVSRQAIEGMRAKMHLPGDYHIFYQPSATVAMHTLLQNLVFKRSYHFVHGAFSALFHNTAKDLGLQPDCLMSDWDVKVDVEKASIAKEIELICITHNETSTGLMWPSQVLYQVRQAHPWALLAIDVTSSFGAMQMDWQMGDVWFGSVQKCLGLPSGLGFMIISPRAFEKAQCVNKARPGAASWQHFDALAEKMKDYQTPETPNMLNIALLARQMVDWDLEGLERLLHAKAELIYGSSLPWKPYVQDAEWRSLTVTNFMVDNPEVWKKRAKEAHMILGSGYGKLKSSCIRLANFPAHSVLQVEALLHMFEKDHLQRSFQ